MDCREALRVGIHGGARNLGRDDIGQIAPGFAADLAGWKTEGNIGFSGAGRQATHVESACSAWSSWYRLMQLQLRGLACCFSAHTGLLSKKPITEHSIMPGTEQSEAPTLTFCWCV